MISDQYLGCLMLDPSRIIDTQVPVEAIDPALQPLYKAMCVRMIEGKPVDAYNLAAECRGEISAARITDMPTAAVSKTLAKHYAEQLKANHKRRQLVQWAKDAPAIVQGSEPDEAVAKLEQGLMSLYLDDNKIPYKSIGTAIGEYRKNDGNVPAVKTGVDILDDAWLLDRGGLHIVAARPNIGKTAISLWLITKLLAQGYKCFMFSIEMPAFQLVSRLEKVWGKENVAFREDDPFWINDQSSLYVEDMLLTATMATQSLGVDCFIVDHLGKLKTREKGLNREGQVAVFSSALKEMARRLDVPVIAVCQLNRAVEGKENKRPELSTLRDSGRIEEDADSVVMLYRPEYYRHQKNQEIPEGEQGLIEVNICKQRNRGVSTLVAFFDTETMRFEQWQKSFGKTVKKENKYYEPKGGETWR